MPVDVGDVKYRPGDTITLDAGSNNVSAGDAVTFDGSGNITPATANDDELIGVVLPTLSPSDGEYPVSVAGLVVKVQVDGDVSAGDTLVPSGTTNGNFEAVAGGMYNPNPDSGADPVAANHPFALGSVTGGGEVLAVFR